MEPTVETIARMLAQQGMTLGAADIARQVHRSNACALRVSEAYGEDAHIRSLFDSVLPDGSMKGRAKEFSRDGACIVAADRKRCSSDYYDVHTGNYYRDLSNWN